MQDMRSTRPARHNPGSRHTPHPSNPLPTHPPRHQRNSCRGRIHPPAGPHLPHVTIQNPLGLINHPPLQTRSRTPTTITIMPHHICITCGTQFPDTPSTPAHCPICEDERQFIGPGGQQWTTLENLRDDHHTVIKTAEPNLTGIGMHPDFAIGQRALLVQTPEGNLLWDCIPLIDDPTIATVRALGGIRAIAISHPHYYTSMVEWSRA